jgi:hypothetical protein
MGQPNSKPKPKPKSSMQRGAKLFLASLSVAATLSGWAWLTRGEMFDVNQSEPMQKIETLDLANLSVRGLRQVGDAMAPRTGSQISASAQPQPLPSKAQRKTRSSK